MLLCMDMIVPWLLPQNLNGQKEVEKDDAKWIADEDDAQLWKHFDNWDYTILLHISWQMYSIYDHF